MPIYLPIHRGAVAGLGLPSSVLVGRWSECGRTCRSVCSVCAPRRGILRKPKNDKTYA